MPKGSRRELTGMLLNDRGRLFLRVDDGGTWRLQTDPRAFGQVGRRVSLEGIRVGFDLLDVEAVWPAGEAKPEPELSWLRRLFG